MNNEVDFITRLMHLQYRLYNKGVIIIRSCEESETKWFVNCFLWKDYQKYQELKINQADNKISVYRNYVTDLNEAIKNCILLLDHYEAQIVSE